MGQKESGMKNSKVCLLDVALCVMFIVCVGLLVWFPMLEGWSWSRTFEQHSRYEQKSMYLKLETEPGTQGFGYWGNERKPVETKQR